MPATVVPVPLNGTSVGEPGALDGIERFAPLAPADAGEKTACTVQDNDGVMVCPEHKSFCLPKSPGFAPVILIAPITRFAVPVFVTVIVCGADELPTNTEPKL